MTHPLRGAGGAAICCVRTAVRTRTPCALSENSRTPCARPSFNVGSLAPIRCPLLYCTSPYAQGGYPGLKHLSRKAKKRVSPSSPQKQHKSGNKSSSQRSNVPCLIDPWPCCKKKQNSKKVKNKAAITKSKKTKQNKTKQTPPPLLYYHDGLVMPKI